MEAKRYDQTGRDITSDVTEIYDPLTNSWVNAKSKMLGERKAHIAVLLPGGKVLVAGGTDDSDAKVASAELYDMESDIWSRTIWMTTDRANFSATALKDGRVFVVGGCGSVCRAPVEFYDPQIQSWKHAQDLKAMRSFHTATVLPDGRMLVVGGTCDCPGEEDNLMPVELLASAPKLNFPWLTDTAEGAAVWYLSEGPHCNSDAIRCAPDVKRYPISFMPPRLSGADGCAPERQSRSWITAAAGGEIRYASDNLVEIFHGYGFRTGYYHVVDLQVSRGDHVSAGQKLGRPSCGASEKFNVNATEVQLRFYTCQMDTFSDINQDFCGPVDTGAHARPIEGLLLSGWTVTERSSNHGGRLVKLGELARQAHPQQCGVDDGCQNNSGKPIRNDLPQQLLSNASFETEGSGDGEVKGWPAAAFTRSDVIPAYSGRFSGQFVPSDKRNVTIGQTVSGVTAGSAYAFQGWLNIPPTTDAFTFTIRIRWRDSASTSIRTDVVANITTDTTGRWNKVGSATADFVAPEGATNAVMTMRVEGLNGELYVDDFLFHAK